MRVNIVAITQLGQREMLVEVEDGLLREVKLVELYSEKILGEIVKERRFTVEQIEVVQEPSYSKHFLVLKRFSKNYTAVSQGYFNGIDWCFENLPIDKSVSTMRIMRRPKSFRNSNYKQNSYLLILGFQNGSI
jgi:hypothetical protein